MMNLNKIYELKCRKYATRRVMTVDTEKKNIILRVCVIFIIFHALNKSSDYITVVNKI